MHNCKLELRRKEQQEMNINRSNAKEKDMQEKQQPGIGRRQKKSHPGLGKFTKKLTSTYAVMVSKL